MKLPVSRGKFNVSVFTGMGTWWSEWGYFWEFSFYCFFRDFVWEHQFLFWPIKQPSERESLCFGLLLHPFSCQQQNVNANLINHKAVQILSQFQFIVLLILGMEWGIFDYFYHFGSSKKIFMSRRHFNQVINAINLYALNHRLILIGHSAAEWKNAVVRSCWCDVYSPLKKPTSSWYVRLWRWIPFLNGVWKCSSHMQRGCKTFSYSFICDDKLKGEMFWMMEFSRRKFHIKIQFNAKTECYI